MAKTNAIDYHPVYRVLDGLAALAVAQSMPMCKTKGEKDTAFVKRIVAAYITVTMPPVSNGSDTNHQT